MKKLIGCLIVIAVALLCLPMRNTGAFIPISDVDPRPFYPPVHFPPVPAPVEPPPVPPPIDEPPGMPIPERIVFPLLGNLYPV
jgi:hypothetical protein